MGHENQGEEIFDSFNALNMIDLWWTGPYGVRCWNGLCSTSFVGKYMSGTTPSQAKMGNGLGGHDFGAAIKDKLRGDFDCSNACSMGDDEFNMKCSTRYDTLMGHMQCIHA